MEKAAWIIVIVVAGAVGSYLLVEYCSDGGGDLWYEEHFDAMDEQMSSLAERLREFKKSHGRYPSTDEGLGVLDNFAVRIKITMFRDRSRYLSNDFYAFGLEGYMGNSERFWDNARQNVRDYRIKHGHPPRTLEELGKAGFFWASRQEMMTEFDMPLLEDEDPETVERELAIGHDDVVFLIGPTGALSPWQMPYVYENRHDAAGTLFADSLADSFGAGRYSVKIDDGVYLWSVVAKDYSDVYWANWFKYVTILCIGTGLLILAVGLIWWKVRGRARIPAVVGLVIAAVVGSSPPTLSRVMTSCYYPTPLFGHRDPAMVLRRRELLDKYRAAGAISDETYVKSIESMGLKATERAVTRPTEGE